MEGSRTEDELERLEIGEMSSDDRRMGFAREVDRLSKKWLIDEVSMRIDRKLLIDIGGRR